jgi:hypothetical protein
MLANTLENFQPRIANNIRINSLVNPCAHCPITNVVNTNMALGTTTDDPPGRFCTLQYTQFSQTNEIFGIPYRRSQDTRILAGNTGPDCILGIWWYEVVIYTQLDFLQRMIFKFEYSPGNHEMYRLLNLDSSKKYALATDDLLLGVHLRVPPLDPEHQPGSRCETSWPQYHCEFNQNFPTSVVSDIWANVGDVEPRDNNSNLARFVERQRLPNGFLWGRDDWNNMQRLSIYLDRSVQDNPIYLSHSAEYVAGPFAENVQMIAYGFRRSNKHGLWHTILLNNGNVGDWRTVINRMTNVN